MNIRSRPSNNNVIAEMNFYIYKSREREKKMIKRFLMEEDGVTAIEYGLIAGLVAIAIVVILGTVGTSLNTIFTTVSTALVPAAM
jgi:pilus assembly protein Flp/PilA